MAFVYGLRANDSADYFYIGSTKHTLSHRLRQHFDTIRLGSHNNKHLSNKVKRIGFENVAIDAILECGEHERFIREYEVINAQIKHGAKLTNIRVSEEEFEWLSARREYDEFELMPRHIHAIVDAFDCGAERTDNELANLFAKVVEDNAVHIFENHFNEFLETVYEVMASAYDEPESDRQAASVYTRIFAMLERG